MNQGRIHHKKHPWFCCKFWWIETGFIKKTPVDVVPSFLMTDAFSKTTFKHFFPSDKHEPSRFFLLFHFLLRSMSLMHCKEPLCKTNLHTVPGWTLTVWRLSQREASAWEVSAWSPAVQSQNHGLLVWCAKLSLFFCTAPTPSEITTRTEKCSPHLDSASLWLLACLLKT